MRQLVCERCIVVVIGFEQFGWRHGDTVTQRLVIGLRTIMAQVCANMGKEGIEPVFASFGLERGNQRFGMVECREAIALVGIEDSIGLEHAPVLGVGFAFGGLDLLRVALVEDRDGRFLTLADLSAELLALAIGHPVGRGVATAVGHHPQPEGVHAAIGRPAGAQGPRDGHTAPRLDPGLCALLELFDDGGGDALGRRSRSSAAGLGHGSSPDRRDGHVPVQEKQKLPPLSSNDDGFAPSIRAFGN